ncbi:alpha/beta fold hydrolase [Aeromicrobium choanae]|uniref:Pimeloyl-ACP methyl ester carboxylesterase n=1 Tax=Aeromicrobium choanae TaxID=1736691 RepID=A0A1T4Z8V4_9ACTN|nr:alpha/beta hydrolase [Aeromicrobium choanae]SKB09985.1 Pimeloyl-ACP methyl ester carboxylesterase [Aeromicrobium choanae]
MEPAALHVVRHGQGRPVVVLHGAGVDHREPEACFEPILEQVPGLRRVYPDLPGMGRSPAPETLRSSDDVLHLMLDFVHAECGSEPFLLLGHSWGAYLAREMAARAPEQVAGLALVCPVLTGDHDVPEHQVIAGPGGLGDDVFRDYFVVQTPEMLERYERFVAPSAELVDEAAMERIGENWGLSLAAAPYPGPTLVVAGRMDSTVGYAGAADLLDVHARATLAVVDDAGHALPHEQPELLGALIRHWLARVAP